MAKKISNGRQTSVTTKLLAAKRGAPSTVATPASSPAVSCEQIGEVAGKVWHLLADQGGMNLTALKKSIDAPADMVLAAVGWLAREGKLEFASSGRTVQVSLR